MITCSPIIKETNTERVKHRKGSQRNLKRRSIQEDDSNINKKRIELNDILMKEIAQGRSCITNKQTIQVSCSI